MFERSTTAHLRSSPPRLLQLSLHFRSPIPPLATPLLLSHAPHLAPTAPQTLVAEEEPRERVAAPVMRRGNAIVLGMEPGALGGLAEHGMAGGGIGVLLGVVASGWIRLETIVVSLVRMMGDVGGGGGRCVVSPRSVRAGLIIVVVVVPTAAVSVARGGTVMTVCAFVDYDEGPRRLNRDRLGGLYDVFVGPGAMAAVCGQRGDGDLVGILASSGTTVVHGKAVVVGLFVFVLVVVVVVVGKTVVSGRLEDAALC